MPSDLKAPLADAEYAAPGADEGEQDVFGAEEDHQVRRKCGPSLSLVDKASIARWVVD